MVSASPQSNPANEKRSLELSESFIEVQTIKKIPPAMIARPNKPTVFFKQDILSFLWFFYGYFESN